MSRKLVVFAGLELRQQILDILLDLAELGNERLPVHLSCNITIILEYQGAANAQVDATLVVSNTSDCRFAVRKLASRPKPDTL